MSNLNDFIVRLHFQEALKALWNEAFPDVKLKGMISDQWKDMGWQGANPSTDFRCTFVFSFFSVYEIRSSSSRVELLSPCNFSLIAYVFGSIFVSLVYHLSSLCQ